MAKQLTSYDPATVHVNYEEIAFSMDAVQTGDSPHIAKTLGVSARSTGIPKICKRTGYSGE